MNPAAAAVRNYVRYLQRLGVMELPVVLPTAHGSSGVSENPGPAPSSTNAAQLAQLAASVRDCQACRLHESRRQVVFGTGNPAADLVFVGEAPGRDEDIQGEPFVGPAGPASHPHHSGHRPDPSGRLHS